MSALLLAAMLVSSSTVSPSIPSSSDPLDAYLESQLELRYSVGFFGPVQVIRRGDPVALGMFGAHYETVFDGSPEALESMQTFRALRIGGFTAWTIGLGVLVTELVILLVDQDILVDGSTPNAIFWSMLISGGVLGAGGGIAMNASNSSLNDAIDAYNQDLLQRIRGDRPGGAKFGLRFSF